MAYYKSDEVHALALDELREGDVNEETYAIALSESDGDARKARALYIKLRAKQYNEYFEFEHEQDALQRERDQERKEREKRREERQRKLYVEHVESIEGLDRFIYLLTVFGTTLLIGVVYYVVYIMPISTSQSYLAYFSITFNYIMMVLYVGVALGFLSFMANYLPRAWKVAAISRIDNFYFDSDFTPIYWALLSLVCVHFIFSYFVTI